MITAIDGSGSGGDDSSVRAKLDANPIAGLFFVLAQLILNAFILELFTGSIIDTYTHLRDVTHGSILLTDSQKEWVAEVHALMSLHPSVHTRPRPHMPRGNRVVDALGAWWAELRNACYTIVSWPLFEAFVMLAVVANVACMATAHADQTPFYNDLDYTSNIVFTAFFGLEAAFKILALGRAYFRSRWHCVEFALVIASISTAALSLGRLGNLVRLLRVLTLTRIIKVSRSLQRLVRTFILAIPAFVNVMCFLGLALFVYTVIGMALFSGIRRNSLYFLNGGEETRLARRSTILR